MIHELLLSPTETASGSHPCCVVSELTTGPRTFTAMSYRNNQSGIGSDLGPISRPKRPLEFPLWIKNGLSVPFSSNQLLLGGAALQRCDKRLLFSTGFSRRGGLPRAQRIVHQPLHSQNASKDMGSRRYTPAEQTMPSVELARPYLDNPEKSAPNLLHKILLNKVLLQALGARPSSKRRLTRLMANFPVSEDGAAEKRRGRLYVHVH
jgi:hypothetical protein